MRRTLLSTALSWPRLALTPKTNPCPDRQVEFRVTGVRCYMKADVWKTSLLCVVAVISL